MFGPRPWGPSGPPSPHPWVPRVPPPPTPSCVPYRYTCEDIYYAREKWLTIVTLTNKNGKKNNEHSRPKIPKIKINKKYMYIHIKGLVPPRVPRVTCEVGQPPPSPTSQITRGGTSPRYEFRSTLFKYDPPSPARLDVKVQACALARGGDT